jgi:hypothetical protein
MTYLSEGRTDTVRPQRLCLQLFRDGNQWGVQVGPNLQAGVAGFGGTVEEAIQALGLSAIQNEQSLLAFAR